MSVETYQKLAEKMRECTNTIRKAAIQVTLTRSAQFFDILNNEIANGRNVYVPITSVDMGHEIEVNVFHASCVERGLRYEHRLPRSLLDIIVSFAEGPDDKTTVKYDFIHSGSSHSNEDFKFDNIQHAWSSVQVQMVSPRIREGISFEKAHFDSICQYTSVSCCTSFSMATQQLARVRRYRTSRPMLYIAVQGNTCGMAHLKTFGVDNVRARMTMQGHFAQELATVLNSQTTLDYGDALPAYLKEVAVRIAAEKQAMIQFPEASMRYWLSRAGWTEVTTPLDPQKTVNMETWEVGVPKRTLAQIPDITEDEFMMRTRHTNLPKREARNVETQVPL